MLNHGTLVASSLARIDCSCCGPVLQCSVLQSSAFWEVHLWMRQHDGSRCVAYVREMLR
jgi:hypothetical protein